MAKKKENFTINVQISSPDSMLWLGMAKAVSSKNSQGDFDILPKHANFITIVQGQPVVVHSTEGEKTFNFKSAVIYTHDDTVQIYANV